MQDNIKVAIERAKLYREALPKEAVKLATKKIGGGADYTPVAERLKALRAQWPLATIASTEVEENGVVKSTCTIWPDKEALPDFFCNGSSQNKLGQIKAYEKGETIAMGRALAKLGYGGDGEIASYEEMEMFETERSKAEAKAKVAQKSDHVNALKKAMHAAGAVDKATAAKMLKDLLGSEQTFESLTEEMAKKALISLEMQKAKA